MQINTGLVHQLISQEFPKWAHLPVKPVAMSGWDNRTFHLGEDMTIRLPSGEEYAGQVAKEQYWLPKLAPHLPLSIPAPIAMGKPSKHYPWHWSIYKWIEGETASLERIADLPQFATSLAKFLTALQQCDTAGAPIAGEHNFYRGGDLSIYDTETREAIKTLGDKIDTKAATTLWETACGSKWHEPPVWIHGDVAKGNLLVNNGRLSAVIDFGQLGIGDPACDLAVAWTLFKGESREAFRQMLNLDPATWGRGRGWALWKALIVYAGLPGTDHNAIEESKRILCEVLRN